MTIVEKIQRLPPVVQRLLQILDEYVNQRTGGEAGDTLSERFAKSKARGEVEGIIACRILDRIDPGHCDRIDTATKRDN